MAVRSRAALAAVTLGVASEALRRTADYVTNRKQFGKPIGTFQGVALRSADYVVTEAGFGADMGAEKVFDIKCRASGLKPARRWLPRIRRA